MRPFWFLGARGRTSLQQRQVPNVGLSQSTFKSGGLDIVQAPVTTCLFRPKRAFYSLRKSDS